MTQKPLTALTATDIAGRLQAKFGDALLAVLADDKHPRVHIAAEHWREVATYLKHDPALAFDWLANLGGIDYAVDDQMAVEVDLHSSHHGHSFAVKVYCSRSQPRVPSVADLWPAANWHEREAWDLLGIAFDGHLDPRRILLADDWVGHPLRKDYVFPREVHGIPGSVELDWQQKP
jgi:NADH-quinone oxidoreductase subunit C